MISSQASNHVRIVRTFAAPAALVWKAWTDPDWLHRWFAPPGCELVIHRMEAREGGEFLTTISGRGFSPCTCLAVFQDVTPFTHLAYIQSFADLEGRLMTAVEAGRGVEWPDETRVEITFKEANGATEVVLVQSLDAQLAQASGALPSWHLMFDRLNEELNHESN